MSSRDITEPQETRRTTRVGTAEHASTPAPRVVVVSNRVPSDLDPDEELPPGGLVSAITPALLDTHGLWFGWSGEIAPRRDRRTTVRRFRNVEYATVDLTEGEIDGYYRGFSNSTLWPMLHGLENRQRGEGDGFRIYHSVNRRFARALTGMLRPGDLVWVHDYHLIPMGQALRAAGWDGRLGYFHHIPIPPRGQWRRIPHARGLRGCLGAYDLIGVQTRADRRRLLEILGSGAEARVGVYPVGMAAERFRSLARGSGDGIPGLPPLGQRCLLMGVERLDYTKGIPQRLEAFERLLRSRPRLREEAVFVQWAAPSREDVPDYRAERRTIERIAARINRRYGEPAPVVLEVAMHPTENVARALRRADIGVVTSVADGMNLVAKEFAAVHSARNPGVLVLSDSAGAAEELSAAVIVEGASVASVAAGLERALDMPIEERRARSTELRRVVDGWTARQWFEGFIADLSRRPLQRRSA